MKKVTAVTIAKALAVICVVIWIILIMLGLTSDSGSLRLLSMYGSIITLIGTFVACVFYIQDH